MLIAIGIVPGDSGEDAMALGGLLCAAFGAEPLLVHVHPSAYDYASMGHVDAEWEQYLQSESRALLDEALERAERHGLGGARTLIHGHRSSGVGLNEVAEAENADLLVIGSAPGGSNGRFQIGSTADQLLHGASVPVALATVNYNRQHPEAIDRLVVAFQNTEESRTAVKTAGYWARNMSVSLTVLTVLLRHRIYGSRLRAGEDPILQQLVDDTSAEQARAIAAINLPVETTTATTFGDTSLSAVTRFDWHGDELFVLSSSAGGALRRVFLGDMTYKLVRATPVPAVVLPRSS